MNLVEQQNQSKRIRNPFQFDFTAKYDGTPYTIPGDNKWYTLVGGLANHAISHLMSKVVNQYHDEQVAKLKTQNRIDEANKFNVGLDVQNLIHKMITGEDMPEVTEEQQNVEIANLDALSHEMAKVTAQAASGTTSRVNISDIVSQAQQDALNGKTSGAFAPPTLNIQAQPAETPAVLPSEDPLPPAQPEAVVQPETATAPVQTDQPTQEAADTADTQPEFAALPQ